MTVTERFCGIRWLDGKLQYQVFVQSEEDFRHEWRDVPMYFTATCTKCGRDFIQEGSLAHGPCVRCRQAVAKI